MEPPRQPVKVVFVLGTQRGGTTILGRVLGQVPRVAFAGEVQRFWEFELAPERTCGCGQLLPACPVWSAVLERVRAQGIDPHQVAGWKRLVAPATRSSRGSRRAAARARRAHPHEYDGYVCALGATYEALAVTYGVGSLVDSSKLPGMAALLADVPDLEPYYVHLVRDPRGVVASQLRRTGAHRAGRVAALMPRAVAWAIRHARARQVLAAAAPGRRLVVRYEDFVSDPRRAANAVAAMVGATPVDWTGATFDLPLVHTPRGPNLPVRTTLTEDISWHSDLSRLERALTAAVTLPWLARYGYLGAKRP